MESLSLEVRTELKREGVRVEGGVGKRKVRSCILEMRLIWSLNLSSFNT